MPMPRRKLPQPDLRETQGEMVARLRGESYLNGPLLYYPAPRPESGPTVESYFRAKFARGEYGTFWLHHSRGWFGQDRR